MARVHRGEAGDALCIHVRLLGVADGLQLWAQRSERPVADLFAVSQGAARALAAALTVEPAAPGREAPMSEAVLSLYLRARRAYHGADRENLGRSVALFAEALALSPEDPTLLTGYALACARQWFFGDEGSGPQAREAATRALHAAPHSGEAALALAVVELQAGDPSGAVRELRQALERAPALADAHELLGRILVETGPLDTGMAHLSTALALDPGLQQAQLGLCRAHALCGAWQETWDLLERECEGHEPRLLWFMRARMALWRRDTERARAWLLHPDIAAFRYPSARLVLDIVTGHRGPELDAHLDRFYLSSAHLSERSRSFYQQVRVEAACGMEWPEAAMAALQEAVRARLIDLQWMDRCPLLARLRRDERFLSLREQVAERARRVREAL